MNKTKENFKTQESYNSLIQDGYNTQRSVRPPVGGPTHVNLGTIVGETSVCNIDR